MYVITFQKQTYTPKTNRNTTKRDAFEGIIIHIILNIGAIYYIRGGENKETAGKNNLMIPLFIYIKYINTLYRYNKRTKNQSITKNY